MRGPSLFWLMVQGLGGTTGLGFTWTPKVCRITAFKLHWAIILPTFGGLGRALVDHLPIVSIVVFLVNQNLYYRILTIKLVNPKKGTTMETTGRVLASGVGGFWFAVAYRFWI